MSAASKGCVVVPKSSQTKLFHSAEGSRTAQRRRDAKEALSASRAKRWERIQEKQSVVYGTVALIFAASGLIVQNDI
jgi:hypothetical protein